MAAFLGRHFARQQRRPPARPGGSRGRRGERALARREPELCAADRPGAAGQRARGRLRPAQFLRRAHPQAADGHRAEGLDEAAAALGAVHAAHAGTSRAPPPGQPGEAAAGACRRPSAGRQVRPLAVDAGPLHPLRADRPEERRQLGTDRDGERRRGGTRRRREHQGRCPGRCRRIPLGARGPRGRRPARVRRQGVHGRAAAGCPAGPAPRPASRRFSPSRS